MAMERINERVDIDPDVASVDSISYQQSLLRLHAKIEYLAGNALGGGILEQRAQVYKLYGAVIVMCMNLEEQAKPEYRRKIKPFLNLDILSFNDVPKVLRLFKLILKVHKYNIKEYGKYGLRPSSLATVVIDGSGVIDDNK